MELKTTGKNSPGSEVEGRRKQVARISNPRQPGENEIRIILGGNPEEFINFEIKSLKKIIYGCKVPPEQIESLEKLIFEIKQFTWIQTSKMEISNKEFKLKEYNRR